MTEQWIQTERYTLETVAQAAIQLRAGELIAFPTETVYGLGAVATNEEAVARVFQVKGRPNDNPLIVHVASIEQVHQYASYVSPLALKLMETFWPGPLTVILPVDEGIFPNNVHPGKKTVGFRMPDQQATLALIEAVGLPLVGPSANLSGKPSPTNVAHVLHDFEGKIAGVLAGDTEQAAVGVESTVVLPQDDTLYILRPGAITMSHLKQVCHQVVELTAAEQMSQSHVMSPGVKYTHYSPKQPVYLMPPGSSVSQWRNKLEKVEHSIGVLADDDIVQGVEQLPQVVSVFSYGKVGDLRSATRQLYAGLRALEQSNCEIIVAQSFEMNEKSHALMNRLTKAAESML